MEIPIIKNVYKKKRFRVMSYHSFNIEAHTTTETYRASQWHGQVKFIVYEMDGGFGSVEFNTLDRLVKYIFSQCLTEEITKILKKNCMGCLTGHPSESSHICIDPQPGTNPLILHLYTMALETTDIIRLEAIFHRSRKLLKLQYSKNDPRQAFNQHIKRCLTTYFRNDFATLDNDLTVPYDISDAVNQACEQLAY